jgi:hypothetical protein
VTRADFCDLLASSIRETVERLTQSNGRLAAYALLTDDDVSTLLGAALMRDRLDTTSDPDLLFSPTNWPEIDDGPNFNVLSDAIGVLPVASEATSRMDAVFHMLAGVLARCKAEGVFEGDVFLSVASTDPGDGAEALEDESIRQLNDPAIVGGREEFIARWS